VTRAQIPFCWAEDDLAIRGPACIGDIGMGINRKDGRVTVIRALDAMVEMGG
jgi:hypothetical protein